MATAKFSRMALLKHWTGRIRTSVLHVISLAQYSLAYVRGWATDSMHPRLRFKAELEQLQQEVLLLREGDPAEGCPHGTHRAPPPPLLRAHRTHGHPRTARGSSDVPV
jgi:hypothetical protein